MLGNFYKNGQGVAKDDVVAYMWLKLSEAGSAVNGRSTRDLLAKEMTPKQITEAERMSQEWKPKKEKTGR